MDDKRRKQIEEGKFTTVDRRRALQFILGEGPIYQCQAGRGLLTVMENGDLVPCRRMPIHIANLLEDNMFDLYKNHPVLKDLQMSSIPKKCVSCKFANTCRGGLKCLTYATTGSYKEKDPGCIL